MKVELGEKVIELCSSNPIICHIWHMKITIGTGKNMVITFQFSFEVYSGK